MAECTPFAGLETLARKVVVYEDGCGILMTASSDDDGPIECTDRHMGVPSTALLQMAYKEADGSLAARYYAGAPFVTCGDYVKRATCVDHPSLETMFREAVFKGKAFGQTTINFMDGAFEVPCLNCDDPIAIPLMSRIMSSFVVGDDGQTYVLIVFAEEAGPVPVTCDNAGVTFETLLSSALVPIPGDCGLWGWRAIRI